MYIIYFSCLFTSSYRLLPVDKILPFGHKFFIRKWEVVCIESWYLYRECLDRALRYCFPVPSDIKNLIYCHFYPQGDIHKMKNNTGGPLVSRYVGHIFLNYALPHAFV